MASDSSNHQRELAARPKGLVADGAGADIKAKDEAGEEGILAGRGLVGIF